MTQKILILSRPKNRLEVQDEDDEVSYQLLYDVTHIESCDDDSYEIFDRNHPNCIYKGVITNVKEVREVWTKCENDNKKR